MKKRALFLGETGGMYPESYRPTLGPLSESDKGVRLDIDSQGDYLSGRQTPLDVDFKTYTHHSSLRAYQMRELGL